MFITNLVYRHSWKPNLIIIHQDNEYSKKKQNFNTRIAKRFSRSMCGFVSLSKYKLLFFSQWISRSIFFFILSGFIISLNYLNKIITVKDLINFQVKRFYRLYPLHFFTLFLVLLIQIIKYFLIKHSSLDYGFHESTNWYSFKNFVGNLFLIQSIFNDFYIFSWNAVSWSISAEFYTYIIFGFLFLICTKTWVILENTFAGYQKLHHLIKSDFDFLGRIFSASIWVECIFIWLS
jgi:hypothetical protein